MQTFEDIQILNYGMRDVAEGGKVGRVLVEERAYVDHRK